jgi:hypothetical protein
MTIIEFIEDPQLLNDQSLSPAQRTALKATYGLPLTMEEEAIFKQTSGRSKYVPGIEQTEASFILGRRSGKSDKLASNIALYEACVREHKVSTGEIPVVMVVSTELQRQSRIVFSYILGKLERSPVLSKMIKNVKADEIELTNGVLIQCYPCSSARIRGASLICLCADEVAWMKVEGRDIDREVLDAARPGLSFPHSKLIKISSPFMMKGEIWSDYRKYFGKDDAPVLVMQGETQLFNPSFSKLKLAAARLRDPVVYETEYLARFRTDLSAMFDPLLIDRAVNFDRPLELSFRSGLSYSSFVDVAGGGGKDSYAIAIGHAEGSRIVLDVVRSMAPQFNPESVTFEYCELLKSYHVREVRGDKYSGDWASSAFEKNGIHYERSEKTKSELYIESESIFNTERVEIPSRSSLIDPLKMLVRKTRSGGHDSVDTDSGQPEDEANVTAGLIWLLSSQQPFFDLTKVLPSLSAKPKPALSDVEASKKAFRDYLAGRRPTPEELEALALDAEILEEEKQIEKELADEKCSTGRTYHGWKS